MPPTTAESPIGMPELLTAAQNAPQQVGPVPTGETPPAQMQINIDKPQPPQAASPGTQISRTYEGPEGQQLTIYATDNVPKSPEAFDAPLNEYINTGDTPKGFLVVKPGLMGSLIGGMTKGLTQVGAAIDKPYSWLKGETPQENLIANASLAKAIIPQTPEKVGATAAMVGATAATGGLSLIPQTLAIGGASALGSQIGSSLTGRGPQIGTALKEAFVASVANFGMGVVKVGINRLLGADAQQQFGGKLVDLIKTKYRDLTSNPQALEAILSTKVGAEDIVQKLSNAYRGQFEGSVNSTASTIAQAFKPSIGDTLVGQVQTALPGYLSTASQNTLRSELRTIYNARNSLLDNIGDDKAVDVAKASINEAQNRIKMLIANEFKGSKTLNTTMLKVASVLKDQETQLNQFLDGADLLHFMKKSIGPDGFDARAFQQQVKDVYLSKGGLVQQGGEIAGRGAPLTSGIDRPIQPLGITRLPKFLGGYNLPSIGTSYASKASLVGAIPQIGANLIGSKAMRNFIGEKGQ